MQLWGNQSPGFGILEVKGQNPDFNSNFSLFGVYGVLAKFCFNFLKNLAVGGGTKE